MKPVLKNVQRLQKYYLDWSCFIMIRSILDIVAYPSTPDIRCYETLYQMSSIHGILQV